MMRIRPATLWIGTLATTVVTLLPVAVQAQTYEAVHAFSREGGGPNRLMVAADGRIYGTASSSGRFGQGSVFVLTPNGGGFDFANIWEFSGPDGWSPGAGVIRGSDGNLYGTTQRAGANDGGTVFRIDGSGSLTTLHNFGTIFSSGGSAPSGIVQSTDGSFYGTTHGGGADHRGTVFRITSSGALTTLHRFTGADGSHPAAGLLLGSDGKFYGTTASGGANGGGTIFSINSSGSLTTLHHFGGFNGADGGQPRAELIQGEDGNYYGTTVGPTFSGGVNYYGTVFRIDASGSLTTLHRFTYSDGASPYAGLTQGGDGNLYGTTYRGGASGLGTVFRISTAGSLTTLLHFSGFNGREPQAPVVLGSDGALYGTTTMFSVQAGADVWGSVFRVTMSGELTTLHVFAGSGREPNAVIQASDGSFYGTTSEGGGGGWGTVFRMDASGAFSTLHNFLRSVDGGRPTAGVIQGSDGAFYGTTILGGQADGSGKGTVFRLNSSGNIATLYSFNTLGPHPVNALIQGNDEKFYGTTHSGSSHGGTIFALDGFGSFTLLHDFGEVYGHVHHGGHPSALVQAADGSFYGTTSDYDGLSPVVLSGEAVGSGTVFRIDQSGAYTTLHRFSGSDGETPAAGLMPGTDGNLYGTTWRGGAANLGTVFRIDPSGSVVTLHSFTGADGAHPTARLLQGSDGAFYGTTTEGGANAPAIWQGSGTIFRITSSGSLTTLHTFTPRPKSSTTQPGELIQGDDGAYYGTRRFGGLYDGGEIFRLTLPPNTPAGSDVVVQEGGSSSQVEIMFDVVSQPGSTSIAPIEPATAGDVPGGFALGSLAYQIDTTAVFSGTITIGFVVPGPITEVEFNDLVVLHNENGVLVDVTATSPARDYTTRTIYATTNSFSPFYIARTGPHVSVLFDQRKPHKAGSTVPIRVALLDDANVNISSASTPLTMRSLVRVGDSASSAVVVSGRANSDGAFRYDAALGGYILNLSTKELAPGRWALTFYAGTARSFAYVVSFEVK